MLIQFDPTNAEERARVRDLLSTFGDARPDPNTFETDEGIAALGAPRRLAPTRESAAAAIDSAIGSASPEPESKRGRPRKRGAPQTIDPAPEKTEPAKVEAAPAVEAPKPEPIVESLADPVEEIPAKTEAPVFVPPVLPEQPTLASVRAAISKVGGTPGLGRDRALAIMKEFGKAEKLPDINPLLFIIVQNACVAALAEKGLVL